MDEKLVTLNGICRSLSVGLSREGSTFMKRPRKPLLSLLKKTTRLISVFLIL